MSVGIPLDVIREILLRLPAPSLFRFKTVCKEWRRLMDDPSFIRSHAANEDSSTTLCITTSARSSVYYLPLDSLEYADGLQTIRLNRVRTSMRSLPMSSSSSNGLKLISYYDSQEKYYKHELWNPLTREFHELPRPSFDGIHQPVILKGSGFGYDYATDDYKVVRIDIGLHEGTYVYETRVYSLKSSSWKRTTNCPGNVYERAGVYVNGSLHWRLKGKIIALDLRTEDYRELPEPPLQGGSITTHMRLDALCGSLVFSWFASLNCYEGWLRKVDCGSWMKLFSFGDLDMSLGAAEGIKPIAYLKSKGQIILQEGCNGCKEVVFHWFDIANNTWKKFTIQGLPKFIDSHICRGSLFRLDQTCHLKRKRIRKTSKDTRLKCFVIVTDTCFHSDYDLSD